MIHYDTFLQNATGIITKCESYPIKKCDRDFLQNASGFLLQNVTVITKCDVYYKLRQYSYLLNESKFVILILKTASLL